MPKKRMTIGDAQKIIDEAYGENIWELLTYEKSNLPCLIRHKCGKEKPISHFSNLKRGNTMCECEKKIFIEEAQKIIDEVYGSNIWELLEYEGSHNPCIARHKCGKEKPISRFVNFKKGNTKCECENSTGRPKLQFDELNQKISDLTYGTYELVELKDSLEFWVNHKSCDRPPFKTTSPRFFSRGQRCSCSKKISVGRKTKKETEAEIKSTIKENESAD